MSRNISIGVPFDVFGELDNPEIKTKLIRALREEVLGLKYDGKIVNLVLRVPDDVAQAIRAQAQYHNMSIIEYTAALLYAGR